MGEADGAAEVIVAIAAAVQAIATGVLVWITWRYTKATQDIVKEMREDRREERHLRLRARAEQAAELALAAIHESRIAVGHGTPDSVELAAGPLHRSLVAQTPMVDDEQVVDRLRACGEALRVYSWGDQQFQGYDRGMASLRVRQLVETTRWTLEAYLAGRELPPWTDLPSGTSAMSWTFGPRVDEDHGGD